jgi:hypothetical protein
VPPAFHLSLLLALALLAPRAASADDSGPPSPSRYYGGFALGVGRGVASVQGARLQFGGRPAAVAMAGRIGLVLSPGFLLGLHLDITGAGSGRVVLLGPCAPGLACPATTTHRVAVNHWSAVASWLPGAGLVLRAGGGLAESFTEDWDGPGSPVSRSFGPGLVAGVGWAPLIAPGVRLSLNLDGLRGWYRGRTSQAGMLTVGVELR